MSLDRLDIYPYTYYGFAFATLAEAEECRTKHGEGAWQDGKRRCIWGPEGKAY